MALNTSNLSIPGSSLGIIVDSASGEGILGKLSPEKPTLFGPVSGATFSGTPRAQIVGEGEAKQGSDLTLTPFKAEPIKLHVSVRTSDEFLWADEDYQLAVIDEVIAPALGKSIGRGVDLIAFHGVNPITGTVSPKVTKYLAQATKTVTANGKPTSEVITAVGLAGGANGLALNDSYAFGLATEINPATGYELNPGMGLGADATSFRGLAAAKSTTVSGAPEIKTASGIEAIVGDWSQVRWGFQREIPMEMLRYGNPDNMTNADGSPRDLAGHNEVLLRAEAVVYVAIGNLDKFALVKNA